MLNFKKKYKKLYRSYYKNLSKIHKDSFNKMAPPTDYFVCYLQFLRDKLLLETPYKKSLDSENMELISLITALDEFDKYNNCIHNFYEIKNGAVVHKAEYSAEGAQQAFQKERTYHWEAFWNLVKLCLEGWCVDAKS